METHSDTIILNDSDNDDVSDEIQEVTESIQITASEEDAQLETEGLQSEPSFEMPDKFKGKTPEEIAKAYIELEKMKNKPSEDEETAEVEGEQDASEDTPEEVEEDPVVQGDMTIEQYQETWERQGGQLSEKQWDTLQKQTGIPMETLKAWEAYVANDISSNIAQHDANVYLEAGGETEYNKMIDWAEANFTDEQITSLNAQLDNPHFYKQGMAILKSAYSNSEGVEPAISVQSSNTAALGADEFHTEQEYIEAMNHPEYGKGGKYDREFDAKLLRYLKRTGQA